MMIGERLREVRQSRHLSLTEVASRADISAATLSRIENNKQGIDLALFLVLAKILKSVPHELLGDVRPERNESDPLATKIAALRSRDRVKMWRDLASSRQVRRKASRAEIGQQVEELLAQFEYLKEQIESVSAGLRRPK